MTIWAPSGPLLKFYNGLRAFRSPISKFRPDYREKAYINTKQNAEVDAVSTIMNFDNEWELNKTAFETIVNTIDFPKIDVCYIYWKP